MVASRALCAPVGSWCLLSSVVLKFASQQSGLYTIRPTNGDSIRKPVNHSKPLRGITHVCCVSDDAEIMPVVNATDANHR